MAQLRTIALPAHLKPRLAAGHPWVYRDQLPKPVRLPDGTWVRVQCGNFRAVGLWDARSPIAVRLFARQRVPDDGWLAERIAQAWARRAPLRGIAPCGRGGSPRRGRALRRSRRTAAAPWPNSWPGSKRAGWGDTGQEPADIQISLSLSC